MSIVGAGVTHYRCDRCGLNAPGQMAPMVYGQPFTVNKPPLGWVTMSLSAPQGGVDRVEHFCTMAHAFPPPPPPAANPAAPTLSVTVSSDVDADLAPLLKGSATRPGVTTIVANERPRSFAEQAQRMAEMLKVSPEDVEKMMERKS